MPLHHTTDGEYRLALAVILQPRGGHNRVNRLRLRRIDEAAGVHHHHVGLTQVGHLLAAMRNEVREIPLGIYRILIAPEGDQTKFEHP